MNKYEKAIQTLDRMRQIVKNDMLTRNEYVTQTVINKKLAEQGAVCRGHKACAIGSLWLAYGVKFDRAWGTVDLPGTTEPTAYAKTRPGLRLALNALNGQASKFIAENEKAFYFYARANRRRVDFDEPIELLFEGAYGTKLVDRDVMLKLITAAKRDIRRQEKAAA